MLPKEERFCLDQQMRRAAVSVTNNIAEGHGRWHYLENSHFCQISRGSVDELIDDINICIDEGYGDLSHNEQLKAEAYFLIGRINGYLAYLKKTRQGAERVKDDHSPLTTHKSLKTL
jgi:four helix bundle protein